MERVTLTMGTVAWGVGASREMRGGTKLTRADIVSSIISCPETFSS